MTANIFLPFVFGRPGFALGDPAVFLSVCGVQSTNGAERLHAVCALSLAEAGFRVKAKPAHGLPSRHFRRDRALYLAGAEVI
jgi:hypothetical protein